MYIKEQKIELEGMPRIGAKLYGLFIQATGVRLKTQKITGEYYLDFAKEWFVCKDSKGNYVNCKVVKPVKK